MAIGAILFILFVSFYIYPVPLQGYAVFLDKSSIPPENYITVNQIDIDLYPLLGDVIDAYDNPDKYPSARMHSDTLIFEIDSKDLEPQVDDLHDYLLNRFRNETGLHSGYVHFSFTDSTSGVTHYYEWSMAVA